MEYHDKEWGRPVHDDLLLFEFLVLEGAQAGLNWLTVLKKRENYRKAFDHFDPVKVAGYGALKILQLMGEKGIIRNRLKIASAVANARAFLKVQSEFGSFDRYIWRFVNGKAVQSHFAHSRKLPAESELSRAISRDLKKRGFNFVGPTICYAFMQAVGLVNDHTKDCFVYAARSS